MFNVLPYEIRSGSEKFHKNMNLIFEGMDGAECSIDDVIVQGKTQTEHDQRLEAVWAQQTRSQVSWTSS